MPSSAVGSVGNDKGAVYCFLFIPPSVAWAAGLSRWGYPPLNPGRPPERAGESTRTPLISPEKLALPRPARGAPLASSLAGFFRETGGQWGPHPRTSPCAPVWPTASACGFFASEKSKPTRSTQQANHHRGPQRKGGWGGRSAIFTCGVGEGRGAPLRLRPGIWGARCGGGGTGAGTASGAQGGGASGKAPAHAARG